MDHIASTRGILSKYIGTVKASRELFSDSGRSQSPPTASKRNQAVGGLCDGASRDASLLLAWRARSWSGQAYEQAA